MKTNKALIEDCGSLILELTQDEFEALVKCATALRQGVVHIDDNLPLEMAMLRDVHRRNWPLEVV